VSAPAPPERGRLTPGLAALLLGLGYAALAALYAWQASGRVSPTIFSDEIEFAQLSRSIAETGSAARRGEPFTFQTLYTYLAAPAWWLDDTQAAWTALKLLGVTVMTATIFPAYALARFVVSRGWAVAAAVASVAAPPLAYAPYLMQEPLAYPVATAGLWACAAYLARPSRGRLLLAAAVALVAWQVRGELAVVGGVLLAGLLYRAWTSARVRAWRATWTGWDRAGFAVLLLGAVLTLSAAGGRVSGQWYLATGFLKQKLVEHASWALAAVGIGVGVLPLVAGLAVLASPHVRATARGHAFVVTGVAAVAGFTIYAGLKGAVVSTVLGPLVVERNLIYALPVLFAATAAALARAAYGVVALAASACLVGILLANAELHLDKYPYFESPALAIGALANRNWAMDGPAVRRALLLTLLVAAVVLLARLLLTRPLPARALALVASAVVAVWAMTAEVYAARGLNGFSERLYEATPKPVDWIDRATGGEPALYLGQQERDPNAVWLTEFWNRSIERVWSVDGSAPAPTLTPDLGAPDGSLVPDPGVEWVVARDGVAVHGEVVDGPHGGITLYRIDGPLRLRSAQTGVEPDGWMGERASFSLYATEDGRNRGFARVSLSREGACGDVFPTSQATVRVGPLVVGEDAQPTLSRVTGERRVRLAPCAVQTVLLWAQVPFHVQVSVSPTFVPREVDPSSGDARSLGAQVGFGFKPFGP
jgi:hypothetical protein